MYIYLCVPVCVCMCLCVWSVCVCLCMYVCVFKNIRMGYSNPPELFRLESSLYGLNENNYVGDCSRTYVSLYDDTLSCAIS